MSSEPENHNGTPVKRARIGQRTMLACIDCKKRKLKCDAQIPTCQNCSKSGRDCLIEDPATGLHRPRDYIRSLEARVAYLENLLHDVRPDVADDHLGATPASVPAMGSGIQSNDSHEARSVNASDRGMDALSSDVALLCVSAAGREPQYFGPSSAVSFSRIAGTTMGLPHYSDGNGSQHSSHGDATSSSRRTATTPKGLPNHERLTVLSHAYFSSIHPQYPFLHRPTVERMERECVQAAAEGNPGAASGTSLFFVLMVCAIGSLTLGHGEVEVAEGYYAMALRYIPLLLELDSLQSIQALLCCAVYSIRSPIGVSLWKISGMAIRHCVELGYHRSAYTYRRSTDCLTQQMSQRSFWVAYDIDRVASFVLGRPVGLSDQSIDAELPLDIDDENISPDGLRAEPRTDPEAPPTTMTGALHAIKLRQLWSKFSNALYSSTYHAPYGSTDQPGPSIESLRQELEEWRATTPRNLKPDDRLHPHPLSVFVSENWFQLAYHYSMLLLYRHCIMEAPHMAQQNCPSVSSRADANTRDRAFQVCAENAREICLRYRRLYQSKGAHVQFTWGSLHILFLGGLTYLYCLWRSPQTRLKTKQTTIMQTCMACTTVLIIIAERWSQAGPYRDIFETLSERTMSMMCGDDSTAGEEADDRLGNMADPAMPTSTAQDSAMFEGNDFDATLDVAGSANVNAFVPLQDWINDLEYMTALGDPQWLAQELLQGIQDSDNDNSWAQQRQF